MRKINTRSPYFVVTTYDGFDKVRAEIYIYSGTQTTDRPSEPNFNLISTFIDSRSSIDISELINDFLEIDFTGVYKQDNLWVDVITTTFTGASDGTSQEYNFRAFNGYGYFEDGANPELLQSALISNETIVKLDDDALVFPVDSSITSFVTFENNEGEFFTQQINSSTESEEQVVYVSSVPTSALNFQSRVINDNGIFEDNACLEDFENSFVLFPTRRVYVEDENGAVGIFNVQNISECTYEPNKLTFINKFGVLQDLWFFKTSKLDMTTKEESYRANTRIDGNYSQNKHQYKTLYRTGKQSLSLNSGFYPENNNEVFKQLLLSESVWINYNGKTLPVNIKTSDMSFKTRLNDSLIHYKIDVEFAYDTINSVR